MKNKVGSAMISILVLIISAAHIYFHSKEIERYLYWNIGYTSITIKYIFWLVLMPIVLLCLILYYKKKQNKRWIRFIVLYSVLLVFSFLRLNVLDVFAPVGCSFTDDPDDFGRYDDSVAGYMDANPETGFPDRVPEGSEIESYSYWYWKAASDYYLVQVSWTIPDEASFSGEIQRLIQCGYQIETNKTVYTCDVGAWDGAARAEILIDWEANRIVYFLNTPTIADKLPESLEEYYTTTYDWKTIAA